MTEVTAAPGRAQTASVRAAAPERAAVTAGLALLAAGAALMVLRAAGIDGLPAHQLTTSGDWLLSSATVLAAVVGSVCIMRWRLIADEVALRLGVALILYAGGVLAVPAVLASVDPNASESRALVRAASLGVVLAVTARAAVVRRPAQIRLRNLLLLVSGAVLLLGIGLAFRPGLAVAIEPPITDAAPLARNTAAQAGVAVAWLTVATLHVRRGLRDDRPLHTWFGLMLFGFAEVRLMSMFAAGGGEHGVWVTGGQVLRVLALLFALSGATRELRQGFVQQRSDLLRTLETMQRSEEERRTDLRLREERLHDVRSTLMAIDAAAHLLERSRGSLTEADITRLVSAMRLEVDRLQGMLRDADDDIRAFTVVEVLNPLVICHRATGAVVDVDVDEELTAVGSPAKTAEVIQNLLDNASRYAPRSRVRLRGQVTNGRVLLRVADGGPGIPPAERGAVFERSWRGSTAAGVDGGGLGLYTCRRLMEGQGGALRLEDSRRGATFVVELPAAAPAGVTAGACDSKAGAAATAWPARVGTAAQPAVLPS